MQTKHPLVVVSGPSGVGKDTIILELVNNFGFTKLPAYTTRPMRPGENDGFDYRFVTHNEFAQLRNNREFLDCTEINGQLYGTPIVDFKSAADSKSAMIVHLKAESALLLQRRVPDVKTVFLFPPSLEQLESRLRGRGMTEHDIAIRSRTVKEECSQAINFDLVVVNHTNEATAAAKKIMQCIM